MKRQKELIVNLNNLEGPQSSAKDRAAGIASAVAGGVAAALVAVAGSSIREKNPITKLDFTSDNNRKNITSLIKERVESF